MRSFDGHLNLYQFQDSGGLLGRLLSLCPELGAAQTDHDDGSQCECGSSKRRSASEEHRASGSDGDRSRAEPCRTE